MIYKALSKISDLDPQIYIRIDDNGVCRFSCNAENNEFQAWLAEGNEPLPAEDKLTIAPAEGT